jgi:hypothetical protein
MVLGAVLDHGIHGNEVSAARECQVHHPQVSRGR